MIKPIALSLILCGLCVLQTAAQSIIKNDRIPKDLVITLSFSGGGQFSAEYDVKITADGKAYLNILSQGLPAGKSFNELLSATKSKNKVKTPKVSKLKDKLSRKQIKVLIAEFENSGFFAMNEYYQGDPLLKETVCINHASTKGLSVSANGQIKNVAFYTGCSYGEKSPFKSFLSLYDKVEKELSGVKKLDLNQFLKSKN